MGCHGLGRRHALVYSGYNRKVPLSGGEVFQPGKCEVSNVMMPDRLRYEQSSETSRELVTVQIDVPISHEQKYRWVCEATLW